MGPLEWNSETVSRIFHRLTGEEFSTLIKIEILFKSDFDANNNNKAAGGPDQGKSAPRLLFLSRREEMGTYTAGCFQSIHQFIFKIDVIPSPNFHEICEPIRWVSERLQDVAQDMERK